MKIEEIVKKYFWEGTTDRDRAIFEAAISLGALYHQFGGVPLKRDKKTISLVEQTIEETISCQPWIEKVKIKIDYEKLKEGTHPYDYTGLSGRLYSAKVISKYEKVRVTLRMNYIPELDFPLMWIEKIEEEEK